MKKIITSLIVLIAVQITINAQSTGWSIQPSPTTQNLRGVSFINTDVWIVVGDAGTILRSSNGGINWTIITSPVADALRGVSMSGSLGLAVGISGRVIRSTDSGLSWTEVTRPTTKDLYSVSISNPTIVATGHEGTILVSTNNGLTWNPHTAGTASILFGVSANGTTAVGVGGQGAVVMSVNSGSGWGLTILGGQLTFFYSTSFVNSATGWAVGSDATLGNVIIKSTNSGFVWTGQTAPTTEQLFGVSFPALDTGTAVGGNGTIIHTSNSGTSWVIQTSGTNQILNAVSFANTNLGIAAGNSGTILRTTNGGLSGIHVISNNVPKSLSLSQNYPNPFNPNTKIKFDIAKQDNVKLSLYNVLGKEVAVLIDNQMNPGTYEIDWNAVNISSGVYFYKMTAGNFTEIHRMVLMK
jgi:photosystem II stability/assembly factor-like uncharacterized protein